MNFDLDHVTSQNGTHVISFCTNVIIIINVWWLLYIGHAVVSF